MGIFDLHHGSVVAHNVITASNFSKGKSLSRVGMDMKLRGHKIELNCKVNLSKSTKRWKINLWSGHNTFPSRNRPLFTYAEKSSS